MAFLTQYPVREDEVECSAMRAQGAGGQNVNKVSSAIHLRFDVRASSLPEAVRLRLLQRGGQYLTKDGVIVIKAQRYRTQELNRADALVRLQALVDEASVEPRPRKPTRVSFAARQRRLQAKSLRSGIKALRGKPGDREG